MLHYDCFCSSLLNSDIFIGFLDLIHGHCTDFEVRNYFFMTNLEGQFVKIKCFEGSGGGDIWNTTMYS